jgi:hypothetical protein
VQCKANTMLPGTERRHFVYTTEELLNIAAQYTTNEEANGPLLVPSGREVVPGSS